MATKAANKRLTREYKAMTENPPPFIIAHPSERNILQWHYVITGPPNTPYANGQYHGLLIFPKDYPYKPPEIRMVTPNGRFATNTRLCLSMSDYHPDTWQPAWSVATILTGLLSFMTGDEPTTGSIQTTEESKKRLARASLEWNANSNTTFIREFPDLVKENMEKSAEIAKRAQEQEMKRIEESNAKKLKEAAAFAGNVDLSKMDPEDRIRFIAAQQRTADGTNDQSNFTYWAYYALAVAVLVGFISMVK